MPKPAATTTATTKKTREIDEFNGKMGLGQGQAGQTEELATVATVETVVPLAHPRMTDPQWTDWVIAQLRDDEKDPKGNPNIDGLRRLVAELLGDVIESGPTHIIGADDKNQMRATVVHTVTIRWGNNRDDVRSFGAAADVYPGNTDDEYARYAAATADTRAEARALRKALRLKKVVASEEITSLPVSESGIGNFIVQSQIKGLDKLSRDLDIDVLKFINAGSAKYKHYTHLRYDTAQAVLAKLNDYLQHPDKIPSNFKGYDADWRTIGQL